MELAGLDSFVILICTKGNGSVTDSDGNSIIVRQGESILVPATVKGLNIVPETELEILSSWIVE
jgi:mannose-6-phosphate isomerase